jgi:hypothetical protein
LREGEGARIPRKSYSREIKGWESYISKLIEGSSLGGGHTFEERLREGEGARIPRKSVGLEEELQQGGFGTHTKEWDWHATQGHLQPLIQFVEQQQRRSYNCVRWSCNKGRAHKSRLSLHIRLARFPMHIS